MSRKQIEHCLARPWEPIAISPQCWTAVLQEVAKVEAAKHRGWWWLGGAPTRTSPSPNVSPSWFPYVKTWSPKPLSKHPKTNKTIHNNAMHKNTVNMVKYTNIYKHTYIYIYNACACVLQLIKTLNITVQSMHLLC